MLGCVPERYGWQGGPIDLDLFRDGARSAKRRQGRDGDGNVEVVRHELPFPGARVLGRANIRAVIDQNFR
jgi:hypothetical protein